jgi:hypothetical protein
VEVGEGSPGSMEVGMSMDAMEEKWGRKLKVRCGVIGAPTHVSGWVFIRWIGNPYPRHVIPAT